MAPDWMIANGPSWTAMTYSELTETAQQDGSILIVPVGSLEQHGDHLPTATDSILVNAIAHHGAECTPEDIPLVITPPIWTGRSPHHLSFGGTVSLDTNALLEVLQQIADTALENGFDAILLLNGHGGNSSVITDAVSEIGVQHSSVEVLGLSYFSLSEPIIDQIRESEIGGISHGGEFETSLMLYLHPDLVHRDQIAGTQREEPYSLARQDLFEDGPLSVYRPFTEYSDSGAVGEPGLATAEKGQRLHSFLGESLSTLLCEIHERNYP